MYLNVSTGNKSASGILPAQMIPKSEKNKEWIESVIDNAVVYGRQMVSQNLEAFSENYQMLDGKFIWSHYLGDKGMKSMVDMLAKEFQIPSYFRHYDIISPIVEKITGELLEHPDIFTVRAKDEQAKNNYVAEKSKRIMEYINEEINVNIQKNLVEMGLVKTEEMTQEELEYYEKAEQQLRDEMTPEEIEKYMATDYKEVIEIWGQNRIEVERLDKRLLDKDRIEMKDLLASNRMFRHHYIFQGATGTQQETWSPLNTFFLKSPTTENPEDGELIGRLYTGTLGFVLERFADILDDKHIKLLKNAENQNSGSATGTKGVDPYGIPFNSLVQGDQAGPFKLINEHLGIFNGNQRSFDMSEIYGTSTSGLNTTTSLGKFEICEFYWKSQAAVGKLNLWNEELQEIEKHLVNEDYVVPDDVQVISIEEARTTMKDVPNTICWFYEPEIWSGLKITYGGMDEALYFAKPCEFQYRSDRYTTGAKLPVVGYVGRGNSLIDKIKPDQVGHNTAMNQFYELMKREIGNFLVMDVNIMPKLKDWAGQNGWKKFMMVAKQLGVTFADTSPANTRGANSGNQLPKMFNLEETNRMLSRLKYAEHFEMAARRRVGMSEQRMGAHGATETATGINQGIQASFAQTKSVFTVFYDYKGRNYQTTLDVAQYIESTRPEIEILNNRSDQTRAYIKIAGTDLLNRDMQVYVTDSQEEVRQAELIRSLFMNNPNLEAEPEDYAIAVTSNSAAEIKRELKASTRRKQARMQREQEMKQQELDIVQQQMQEKMEWEKEKHYSTLESQEYRTYMQSFLRQEDNLKDSNGDQTADILQFQKQYADEAWKQRQQSLEERKIKNQEQATSNEAKKTSTDQLLKLREIQAKENIAIINRNAQSLNRKEEKKIVRR